MSASHFLLFFVIKQPISANGTFALIECGLAQSWHSECAKRSKKEWNGVMSLEG
jgi:hypothetical protein